MALWVSAAAATAGGDFLLVKAYAKIAELEQVVLATIWEMPGDSFL